MSNNATMTTARDVIAKAVCHDEQLEIWADEFLEHFLAGDFLRPPETYEDKLSLVRTIKDAIRDLVEKAFDHPELQSEPIRQELAALLNPWRPIETAPKTNQEPIILHWKGRRPMEGFWYGLGGGKGGHGWYASGPITPSYEPSGWLPLPTPPSEDKP